MSSKGDAGNEFEQDQSVLPSVATKLVPCNWCEREDQETCPECEGTGFVEVEGAHHE